MDFDASAYEMLHRSSVEWPCLSMDPLIRERIGGPTGILNQKSWFPSQAGGALDPAQSVYDQRLNLHKHVNDKYPMQVYFCAGSQGLTKGENKIYVLKWDQMAKTLHDDEQPDIGSEDDEEDIIERYN